MLLNVWSSPSCPLVCRVLSSTLATVCFAHHCHVTSWDSEWSINGAAACGVLPTA